MNLLELMMFIHGLRSGILFVKGFGQISMFEDEYRLLLHVEVCVSMVRKIPVCWRHLAFWETFV